MRLRRGGDLLTSLKSTFRNVNVPENLLAKLDNWIPDELTSVKSRLKFRVKRF